MTRDEIISMARAHSSAPHLPWNGQWIFKTQKELLAFARGIAIRARAEKETK